MTFSGAPLQWTDSMILFFFNLPNNSTWWRGGKYLVGKKRDDIGKVTILKVVTVTSLNIDFRCWLQNFLFQLPVALCTTYVTDALINDQSKRSMWQCAQCTTAQITSIFLPQASHRLYEIRQPPTSSYNFQLPHGRHSHHGRHGHGGQVGHGGCSEHGGHGGQVSTGEDRTDI